MELTRRTLIAALDLRYTPRHTSALRPPPYGSSPTHLNSSVSVYDGGNHLCSRHIFRSIIKNRLWWRAHKGESSREPWSTLASRNPSCFVLTCSRESITTAACSIGKQYSDSLPPPEDSICLRDSKEICNAPKVSTERDPGDSEAMQTS